MNEWLAVFFGFVFGLCAVLPIAILVLRPFPLVPGQPPEYDVDDVPQLPRATQRQSPRVVVFDPDGTPVLKMD